MSTPLDKRREARQVRIYLAALRGEIQMSELVATCPRCGAASMTFDVYKTVHAGQLHNWQNWFETFSVCRNCHKGTIFVISQKDYHFFDKTEHAKPESFKGSLNPHFDIDRFISLVDRSRIKAPEHTPKEVVSIFDEASSSVAVGNWNAAGAMFRLAIGLATEPLLPQEPTPGLTRRKRRDLGPRVEWLMETGRITTDLYDLSECIREDGNDGAHDGTLTKEDAADLLDFTVALFERMFTEPERLRLAKERRDKRRAPEE
jgi:hypothetical protein